MKYILGIDQSTQGTKLMLFDAAGHMISRVDRPHRQIINAAGWVSHDMNEIWFNILSGIRELLNQCNLTGEEIAAIGISNQRETTVAWDQSSHPLCDAIVWQCSRASEIAGSHASYAEEIKEISGLSLSPFYPAAKMEWLLRNVEEVQKAAREGTLHLGTVDSYLIYRMTGHFLIDASNASRTQLMELKTCTWSKRLLEIFGIHNAWLGKITDSNGDFGVTDFEGILPRKVPVTAVLGDSHAALFGHGCKKRGETKVTYGTGSSIMMNTGDSVIQDDMLSSSVAWRRNGRTVYCLEGNINYTGAVNTWLKDDVHLFDSSEKINGLIAAANPADHTMMIPAFTGLSAPYWDNQARAAFLNMSRTTGKAEMVKAANESIALQIADVVEAMEKASHKKIISIHADGGPTGNAWLMQYQADILNAQVLLPEREELSGIGAVYLAGITMGLYDEERLFHEKAKTVYSPKMQEPERRKNLIRWHAALEAVMCFSDSLITLGV